MKLYPPRFHVGLALIVLMVGGCDLKSLQIQPQETPSQQSDVTFSTDPSLVPQTLEPAPESQPTESATSELVASLPAPETPKREASTPQQALTSTMPSTNPQLTKNSSTQPVGKVFGEFPGVTTKWKEMKQQLADQLEQQERKTEKLKVKLQLIEQIAEYVNFTTKVYVARQNLFLAEFTIENPTPYAMKDISITCDQVAPTRAIIHSHTETIYDIIKPTTRSTYSPIPFGTKHRQTQSLQCQITNFTVHNP